VLFFCVARYCRSAPGPPPPPPDVSPCSAAEPVRVLLRQACVLLPQACVLLPQACVLLRQTCVLLPQACETRSARRAVQFRPGSAAERRWRLAIGGEAAGRASCGGTGTSPCARPGPARADPARDAGPTGRCCVPVWDGGVRGVASGQTGYRAAPTAPRTSVLLVLQRLREKSPSRGSGPVCRGFLVP